MQPPLFKALGLPYKAVGGIIEDTKRCPARALLEKWGLKYKAGGTSEALEGLLDRVRVPTD